MSAAFRHSSVLQRMLRITVSVQLKGAGGSAYNSMRGQGWTASDIEVA